MQQLSEHEINRRNNLEKIKSLGINPYPADEYVVENFSKDLKNNYEENQKIKIAGRLMQKNIMGSASFAQLQDSVGSIQLYFNRDVICQGEDKTMYNDFFKKMIDLGDFIGVEGEMFKTHLEEISVRVHSFTLLSKSIKPLPLPKEDKEGNVHDAFTNPELRYRQKYVDLIVNKNIKDIFIKRTKIFKSFRNFFDSKGYLEVETPILQSIPGGATARPFITHHNSLNIPLYLRIANELYLKRLIVGGFDAVYEFAKDFRNEGMDKTHNPEFTALEFYVAYKDYNWMMNTVEELLENTTMEVLNTNIIEIDDKKISMKAPFQKISMTDSIIKYANFDISNKSLNELSEFAKSIGVEVDNTMGKAKIIDEIFGVKVEPNLIQPTFIIDYPLEMSPLCKKHRNNPELTERFELFINCKEIANAYSELNDPIDQRQRFEDQVALKENGDEEAMYIDHDFLRAIEYGMPPTSGCGIGMDRLVMLLTGQESIQEVLFFPQMKPEQFEIFRTNNNNNDFEKIGVNDEWLSHIINVFPTISDFSNKKPTVVHQLLNAYRKKHKLEITALQLDEVNNWFSKLY